MTDGKKSPKQRPVDPYCDDKAQQAGRTPQGIIIRIQLGKKEISSHFLGRIV